MASPVNLRISAPIPFPALVRGAAPIALTKANGVWTVSLDVQNLGAVVPLIAQYASDYVVVWDSVGLTFVKVSLTGLGLGGARLQRSVLASPIVIAANDQIINFNINAGAPTCTLPSSISRNGVPLTFQDVGGHAAAHNLTFAFTGGELADGLAAPAITVNYGKMTFTPMNDGVNTGYSIS